MDQMEVFWIGIMCKYCGRSGGYDEKGVPGFMCIVSGILWAGWRTVYFWRFV